MKATKRATAACLTTALLGLGAVGCDQQPASVGQAPFYELTSNQSYTRHPPWTASPGQDGGVETVGTLPSSGPHPTYLIAWASSDQYACYGFVSSQEPLGDVQCSGSAGTLTSRSAPSLFSPNVPLIAPDAGVVEFGFTHGPIRNVEITMAGTPYHAEVTSLISSDELGAYAFSVPGSRVANSQSVSTMTGLTASGTKITSTLLW